MTEVLWNYLDNKMMRLERKRVVHRIDGIRFFMWKKLLKKHTPEERIDEYRTRKVNIKQIFRKEKNVEERIIGELSVLLERQTQQLRKEVANSYATVKKEVRDHVLKQVNEEQLALRDDKTFLLVAGTGFSGNTAVRDFFRNYDDCESFLPEMDYFRCAIHGVENAQTIPHLYNAVKNREPLEPIIDNFRRFYRHLFWSRRYDLLGENFLVYSEEYAKACLLLEKTYTKLIDASSHEQKEFLAGQYVQDFISVSKTCMKKILGFFAPEKKISLYTHGIRYSAPLEEQLPFFPKNTKIVRVIRDPRDSWTDMKARKDCDWWTPKTVEDYIKSLPIRTAFLQADVPNAMTVRFEDICLNYEDTKNKLLDFVGLDRASAWGKAQYFDPALSRKNIGIHVNHPNQTDIRKIEMALPEYLYVGE